MIKKLTILFDLDGTLIDTAPDLVQVLNQMLAIHSQPPVPYAIARNEVSNGALGLIKLGFGDTLSDIELEKLRLEFLACYVKNPCNKAKLFDGIEDLLKFLEKQNIKWGIVTNKPQAMTEPLLKSLGIFTRAGSVVSGDRLPERKPHPAPVLLGAKELRVSSNFCVYIGDAPRDIEAGRAAGMATIATSYGYIRANDNVKDWNATMIVRRPRGLKNAINHLNNNE